MEVPKEIAKVNELRKTMPIAQALKQAGVKLGKYHYWTYKKSARRAKKQAKIVVTDLPEMPEEKAVVVIGSARVVAQILGQLK